MEVPTLKSSTGTLPQPLPDPVSPATAHPKTEHSRGCSILCRSWRRIRAGTPLHQSSLRYSSPHQSPRSVPIPTPQATLTMSKSAPPAELHLPSIHPAGAQSKRRPRCRHGTVTAARRDSRKTAPKLPPSVPAGWLQLGCS